MSETTWYEVVAAEERITQGDLILNCPLLSWDAQATLAGTAGVGPEMLMQAAVAFRSDVVVMTQACDLEHGKVANVVLCPHVGLSRFRQAWEIGMRNAGASPTEKSWRRTCDDIANGHVWHQSFLNSFQIQEPSTEIGVVDFRDLFTVPRTFLEDLLLQRGQPRLRLQPPYREHLSQAFARFFMRVGLPQPVEKVW